MSDTRTGTLIGCPATATVVPMNDSTGASFGLVTLMLKV